MLNQQQYDQLLKPLNPSRIAKRSGGGGKQLSYLETWEVKAHLIRIFGFGGWSWDVLKAELAFEEKNEKGQWSVGYKVIGTLTVPSSTAYGASYTEAAIGSASLPQRGEAHDMAIKTAESDALKRAAINLGDQFGLSLYDNGSTQAVVTTTLDREDNGTIVPVIPVAPIIPPTADDSEGAALWIEEMKSAIAAKDVEALLVLKKDMNEQAANELVFQGTTLAKWLDKAMVQVGK